jgi:hypothetical protein
MTRREHQDRQRRAATDLPTDLEAIDGGHVDVEDEQIRRFALERGKHFGPSACGVVLRLQAHF